MTEKYPVYEYEIPNINILYFEIFNEWCKENCNGRYRLADTKLYANNVNMFITFIEKGDAMKFKLRWL